MNQVPGALLVLSLFFVSLPCLASLSLSLPLFLALGAFFSYATGRSADLLSQLELVISLRHVSVCAPRVRVRRDKRDVYVRAMQDCPIRESGGFAKGTE